MYAKMRFSLDKNRFNFSRRKKKYEHLLCFPRVSTSYFEIQMLPYANKFSSVFNLKLFSKINK